MSTTSTRSASSAILTSEARLLLREPGVIFWVLAFPTLLLVVLGLIPSFRDAQSDLGGQRVVDLYVPVAVLLGMIMAALQALPHGLSSYRERGILRRLRVTPVRPAHLLAAQIAVYAAASSVSALVVLAVGKLGYGVDLPDNALGYIVAFVLAMTGALALGATLAAIAPTTRATAAISSCVFFPTMFTAGVWMPVQTMPGMLRTIVESTPMGAGANALNTAAVGGTPEVVDLAVVIGWSIVFIALAVRLFRWE
ncbi:MAG TPA: ABC transporter permease [Nocardioidaceae bacterium]|nr:ABC transporter permease [Nocardioidaceae bacterium]